MNKYPGRQIMMRNAEKYGQLAVEHYGSRNGLTSILQVTNNKTTFAICGCSLLERRKILL
jgi:hypothetical protein